MRDENWIADELEALRGKSLDRHLRVRPSAGGKLVIDGQTVLNFSSNDYLDLARHPAVVAASLEAVNRHGCSATASRLMAGTLPCHEELENALAAFKGYPAAVAFGSGWLANAGTIPALVDRNDHVYADKLVHASIIDATLLARANLHRFNHNEAGHLAVLLSKCPPTGRRIVITESVFSMDGDIAPLKALADVAEKYHAMMVVDEAHSTGIFGPAGAGLVSGLGLASTVNISMGTLSKALGSYGGFIACSALARDLVINRARTFIYTTGLPPAAAGAALGALKVLNAQPDLGQTLLDNATFFRNRLHEAGLRTATSASQIVPILVGDPARALALAARLAENGLLAVAVRPPTVPAETSRLRLSVTLAHTRADLENAAAIIAECARLEGVS